MNFKFRQIKKIDLHNAWHNVANAYAKGPLHAIRRHPYTSVNIFLLMGFASAAGYAGFLNKNEYPVKELNYEKNRVQRLKERLLIARAAQKYGSIEFMGTAGVGKTIIFSPWDGENNNLVENLPDTFLDRYLDFSHWYGAQKYNQFGYELQELDRQESKEEWDQAMEDCEFKEELDFEKDFYVIKQLGFMSQNNLTDEEIQNPAKFLKETAESILNDANRLKASATTTEDHRIADFIVEPLNKEDPEEFIDFLWSIGVGEKVARKGISANDAEQMLHVQGYNKDNVEEKLMEYDPSLKRRLNTLWNRHHKGRYVEEGEPIEVSGIKTKEDAIMLAKELEIQTQQDYGNLDEEWERRRMDLCEWIYENDHLFTSEQGELLEESFPFLTNVQNSPHETKWFPEGENPLNYAGSRTYGTYYDKIDTKNGIKVPRNHKKI